MIVTSAQVYQELGAIGVRQVECADRVYFCPSQEWLKEFVDYLEKTRRAYKAERWDCDNFSRWAAAKADEALYDRDDLGECSHTFAEMALIIKGEGVLGVRADDELTLGGFAMHAANLVRLNDNHWYYVEPQTSRFAVLDSVRNGIGTITAVRL